ncbi:MAG: zf-TFIIB domain-containing protein [Planctomycetota bacterium]
MQRMFPGLKKRKCPQCGVSMEASRTSSGVEIDRCPECDGIWLDHGELREIVQAKISERANPRDMAAADRSERMCPDCERELFEHHFGDSSVRIDQCIHCAGIFLDSGELTEIRRAVKEND